MDGNKVINTDDFIKSLVSEAKHQKELARFLAESIVDTSIPGFVFGSEGALERDTLVDMLLDWAEMELENHEEMSRV